MNAVDGSGSNSADASRPSEGSDQGGDVIGRVGASAAREEADGQSETALGKRPAEEDDGGSAGQSDTHAGRYGGGVGSRREAREAALGLLYEAEAKGVEPASVLAELPVKPASFTLALVVGVGKHQAQVDSYIRSHARGWKLERMPAVDRAVLRLAIYELLHEPDIPTATVISEAVELAKRFSTDESGRFVNGMLSSIAKSVRS
ncbi:MAG: transcription antitermination factor NusB [Acidimicrobiales bacterium]|nr:transcription antitermination factor NusB [Acidimicrobiales bacterium]